MRIPVAMAALALAASLIGCAVSPPDCTQTATGINAFSESTTIPDHTLAPPGNQQQFLSTDVFSKLPSGCATPAVVFLLSPTWTVSDPINVQITSGNLADGTTNGLATCLGATTVPATVTATVGTGATAHSASTTITCK